ncbi:TBC1 domain family member 13 isoform X3 [Aptenodytes patagonicus]|uniref:TBC1 domain family member 13 isoform X3 n=1 Tax=Aptenodytes patagonicus TaxID=9234 RepID=UPI003F9FA477
MRRSGKGRGGRHVAVAPDQDRGLPGGAGRTHGGSGQAPRPLLQRNSLRRWAALPVLEDTSELPPFRESLMELFAEETEFLKEMIIQPGIAKANLGVSREDVTLEDHPLNPNPDSRWNTYFKDNEVLLQIDKDVRRLYPDMAFFQRPTDYPCLLILDPQNEFETLRKRVEQTTLKSQTVARNRSGVTNVSSPLKTTSNSLSEYEVLPNGCEAHWEVVERILFIYAKLNPGIAYVQGMNEIVGPLYYTFATDPNSEWKEHAEADTFFCFTNLMAEIRDNFIKSLDDSQCGITYKMEKVYSTLKEKDVELYLKLGTGREHVFILCLVHV